MFVFWVLFVAGALNIGFIFRPDCDSRPAKFAQGIVGAALILLAFAFLHYN